MDVTAPTYTPTSSGNVVVDGPLSEETLGASIVPASAYTDEDAFAHEQQTIFRSGWSWVGYAHWLPHVGDVRPVTVAGSPLLLVRRTRTPSRSSTTRVVTAAWC